LPENYKGPLENYSNKVINKSYSTKLYLSHYIFLLHFEFDCGDDESDALPKVTNEQITIEEEIDEEVKTKPLLHRTKMTHIPMRREITECILELGDLALDEYLKTYGKGLNNVDEFLAIYEPAEKKFQRDLKQFIETSNTACNNTHYNSIC
jgi:exonuclease VII small subunit